MRRKNYSLNEITLRTRTQNAEIRVLLVVQDEESKQRYLEALADSGASVFVTSSLFNLGETICTQTYHGLLLDVLTKMEAIKENKAEVYRLTERFPVAHLKINGRTGEIRCFYVGRLPDGTILDFIDMQCRSFDPQGIRTTARKELHLPVLIYRNAGSKRPERAVTQDISPNGCFIISARPRREGDEVILRFPDLTDASIKAQIRVVVEWGERRQLPGIAVQFQDLSLSQITEITAIMSAS